jgi:2-phosphosulfolactate phosphatase
VVIAGCLRNAAAVSAYLQTQQGPFAIIAAGERWSDTTLRASIEDVLGAGAIIDGLTGSRSPEAELAGAAYRFHAARITELLHACSSDREMIEKGHPRNVALAAELNVSGCVPLLRAGSFARA